MSDNRKIWTTDEDHAITTLVKKHGTHHWSEISKRLLDQFGSPGRTGKQCRERWHNHLNPKINKSPWSIQQQKQLFHFHNKYGNKWKTIAQNFKGRTDNDIKNKFYSTIRKKLRRINKLLGVKNSTTQVKQIKPKVLSNIIAAASTDNQKVQQAWQELSKVLFCQDDKKLAKLIKGEDRTKIQQLIKKINAVNQTYLEIKQKQKNESKSQLKATVQYRNSNQQSDGQQKNDPGQLRRITLRRRQTSKNSTKQKPITKKEKNQNSQVEQQNAFNFNLNLNENFSPLPGFFSTLSSFTPTLNKKRSLASNQMQNTPFEWREEYLNSPRMLTRSFIRTPNLPTPGTAAGPFFDFKFNAYDFGNKESYNQLVNDVQNRINKQTMARR